MTHYILATVSLLLLWVSLSSGATMYLSPDGPAKSNTCRAGECSDQFNPCGPTTPNFEVILDDNNCIVELLPSDKWATTPLTIQTDSGLTPDGEIKINSNGPDPIRGLDLTYRSAVTRLPVRFSIGSTETKMTLDVDGNIIFDRSDLTFLPSASVALIFARSEQTMLLQRTKWNHDSVPNSIEWRGGSTVTPGLYLDLTSVVDVKGKFFSGTFGFVDLKYSSITSSGFCNAIQTSLTIAGCTIDVQGTGFVYSGGAPTALPDSVIISDSTIQSASTEGVLLPESSGCQDFSVDSSTFINVAPFARARYKSISRGLAIRGTTFENSPLYLEPGTAAPNAITVSTFKSPPAGLSALALSGSSTIELIHNTYASAPCVLSLDRSTISDSSDEFIESVCIAGGVTWLGNLTVGKEIGLVDGGGADSLLRFTNSLSHVTVGSPLTFGVTLDFEPAHVHYTLNDPPSPISATPAGGSVINKLPTDLAVYWSNPSAGTYTIITDVATSAAAPTPIQTSNAWTFDLRLEPPNLIMVVYVDCSSCNTAHAYCTQPNVCECTGGWTGPTCNTVPPVTPETAAQPPTPTVHTPSPVQTSPAPVYAPLSVPQTSPSPTASSAPQAPTFSSPQTQAPSSPPPTEPPTFSPPPTEPPTFSPPTEPPTLSSPTQPPTLSGPAPTAPLYIPPSISPSQPPVIAPVPVGCGASPGPQFICVNGEWIINSPVEEPTVVIPGNTGTVVINGDLNVTSAITFSGLNSQVVVNGCVVIRGGVEIELTEQEVEQLAIESGGKGSKSKNLLSKTGNTTCPDATDLDTVPLSLKAPSTCTKLTSQNASTKSSLTVLFTVDNSGCKKSSKIAAIVVPSVIGGLIVLAAVGTAVGLVLKKKAEKSSKARLSIGNV